MNAYLVSHNGLGDNLFMIGALRFLQTFYNKIFFLCKNKYYNDVVLFFNNTNIECIGFDENREYEEISKIISQNYNDNDILVCGPCHKSYLQTKITHKDFLNFKPIEKGYTIDYDTFDSNKFAIFKFIENFYKDINLNLTYFYEYFDIPSIDKSLEYYNDIKQYYIIFIQNVCSDGRKLNISNLINKYINDEKVIIISSNENIYNIENKTEHIIKKYNICKKILSNSKIINYTDIILNSDEIYIIDSCFTGIVLPYLKMNKLNAKLVRIIYRELVNSIVL